MASKSPRSPRASAPGRQLRLLCVHGIGGQEADPQFAPSWRAAILDGLHLARVTAAPRLEFLRYDDLFAAAPRDLDLWRRALSRLLASGANAAVSSAANWVSGLFGQRGLPTPGTRGLTDWLRGAREELQWTAGMVAQWAADEVLRAEARKRLAEAIREFEPDAILAHSLGSLICYDTFARPGSQTTALLAGRVFVSFGSQINNPFVRDRFGGRIGEVPARHWFHLYNPHDDAFTAPIKAALPGFTQVNAPFDIAGFLDHDATAYLRHPQTAEVMWRSMAAATAATPPPLAVAVANARALPAKSPDAPARAPRSLRDALAFAIGTSRRNIARRALLVGINDYPRPEMRLEGCVNDVYLVSERLQELGFAADNIRIVLNERATAAAIRDRLEWLLDGCGDQQGRVFFYSGHGAQLPGYGAGETVDRADECLVPFDFDWTPQRAILDNWFYELYSQLPAAAEVLAIFDCCHSGGLSRDGGARVRGLAPPDDIRHRVIAWDAAEGAWTNRTGNPSAPGNIRLRKMFRGARALAADQPVPWDDPKPFGHAGPFFPVLLEACQEGELACEHRNGAAAYGAFTWALGQLLAGRRRPRTWGELRRRATEVLTRLGYAQTPGLEGPPDVAAIQVPWQPEGAR